MNLTAMPLANRGILSVTGPDSRKLLQGQCTADVQTMQNATWTLGGLCTPKGRLYANFRLVCLDDEHFWLIMPRANVAGTLERLGKYAAFFKCELADISLQWHGIALTGIDASARPGAMQADSGATVVLELGGGQQLLWLNPLAEQSYEERLQALEADAQWRPENHWDQQEIAAGLVWVTPETQEAFLPQSIAWDQLGGVSFSKGCYTGQEVVARLHYKGSAKKGLRRVEGSGATPAALSRLLNNSGKAVGELATSVEADDNSWTGLAVLSLQAEQATLNDRPVTLGDWVYTDAGTGG